MRLTYCERKQVRPNLEQQLIAGWRLYLITVCALSNKNEDSSTNTEDLFGSRDGNRMVTIDPSNDNTALTEQKRSIGRLCGLFIF